MFRQLTHYAVFDFHSPTFLSQVHHIHRPLLFHPSTDMLPHLEDPPCVCLVPVLGLCRVLSAPQLNMVQISASQAGDDEEANIVCPNLNLDPNCLSPVLEACLAVLCLLACVLCSSHHPQVDWVFIKTASLWTLPRQSSVISTFITTTTITTTAAIVLSYT